VDRCGHRLNHSEVAKGGTRKNQTAEPSANRQAAVPLRNGNGTAGTENLHRRIRPVGSKIWCEWAKHNNEENQRKVRENAEKREEQGWVISECRGTHRQARLDTKKDS